MIFISFEYKRLLRSQREERGVHPDVRKINKIFSFDTILVDGTSKVITEKFSKERLGKSTFPLVNQKVHRTNSEM